MLHEISSRDVNTNNEVDRQKRKPVKRQKQKPVKGQETEKETRDKVSRVKETKDKKTRERRDEGESGTDRSEETRRRGVGGDGGKRKCHCLGRNRVLAWRVCRGTKWKQTHDRVDMC